jgi:hypothetical protein
MNIFAYEYWLYQCSIKKCMYYAFVITGPRLSIELVGSKMLNGNHQFVCKRCGCVLHFPYRILSDFLHAFHWGYYCFSLNVVRTDCLVYKEGGPPISLQALASKHCSSIWCFVSCQFAIGSHDETGAEWRRPYPSQLFVSHYLYQAHPPTI